MELCFGCEGSWVYLVLCFGWGWNRVWLVLCCPDDGMMSWVDETKSLFSWRIPP